MIFKSQVFDFVENGWPREIHIMRGDIVRVVGKSDQNGVEMSLFVVGGLGVVATERAWTLKWTAQSDRAFYVVSLRRRVGARPEEKVAEMRVYVYDTPPASFRIQEETDIITHRCELQCAIKETIRSVDFEVGNIALRNELVEENQCNLSFSGLLPGTHSVSGRVNLTGGKGAVTIAPQQVTLTEIFRLRVTPPLKEINLTQEIGLKSVEIRAEPLVGIPSLAKVVILLNQKPQVVMNSENMVTLPVENLMDGEYAVQAVITYNGKNRLSAPFTFTVRRDMATEVQRIVTIARGIPLDACTIYITQLATNLDPLLILKSASQALESVQKSLERNNGLPIPGYLPDKFAMTLRELQTNRREALVLSRVFLAGEIEFWSFLKNAPDISKGKIAVLIAARDIPLSQSVVVSQALRKRIDQDVALVASLMK
ncbi:hypothetical protein [Armatimonas sp.]|uniref:hypothetical protein n=1 Tax=Armatimonas sp. TaxID=1872638 RepID=UPI0037510B70